MEHAALSLALPSSPADVPIAAVCSAVDAGYAGADGLALPNLRPRVRFHFRFSLSLLGRWDVDFLCTSEHKRDHSSTAP